MRPSMGIISVTAVSLLVGSCSGDGASITPPPIDQPELPVIPELPDLPILNGSGVWSTGTPLPEPIQEFHGAVLNGRIYVAGGFIQGNVTSSQTWRFDPFTDSWERRADLPGPRHHMPLVAVGDSLFAVGGLTGTDFVAQGNLWMYTESADEWVARPGPPPRGASAAAVLGGKIYLIGGYGTGVVGRDVDVYDPSTATWSRAAPLPVPLDHLEAAVVGGHLYAVCGRQFSVGSRFAVVQRYDPVENRWEVIAEAPTATAGHAVAVLNGRIHVLGGEGGQTSQTHFAFDPAEEAWTLYPSLPTGRHGLAAAVLNDRIFAIGGGPIVGLNQTNTVEIFESDEAD